MIKMPTRFMSPSVTELGEAAPVRLSLLLQRAPQIALSPAQRTRGPPLTIPLSMRPKMDSPDRARENRKSDRIRSEEHTSELQSRLHLVCRLLLEKKKKKPKEDCEQHEHL